MASVSQVNGLPAQQLTRERSYGAPLQMSLSSISAVVPELTVSRDPKWGLSRWGWGEVNAFGDIGNVPGTCTELLHPSSTAIPSSWFQMREQSPERQCEFPRGLQPEAEQECGTPDLSDGC